MPQKDLTEIVCIIDRSGSMADVEEDARGGFNKFLEDQKALPGDAHMTLVKFDHEYTLEHNGVHISEVEPLTTETYVPRGTTALLDAIGRTIDDVGKRLKETPEHNRPEKVIVVILTDGLENASRDYSRVKVFEMIGVQKNTYKWEFIFLAADQDAIAAGRGLNISAQHSVSYKGTSDGTRRAYGAVCCAVSGFRASGKTGDWKSKLKH